MVIEVPATHIITDPRNQRLVCELYPGVLAVDGCRGAVSARIFAHRIAVLPAGDHRTFTVDEESLQWAAQQYTYLVEQTARRREHAATIDDGARVAECVWPPRGWTSHAVFAPPPAADTMPDP